MAAQQVQTSTLEPIERSCLGGGRELERRVERASLEARFRSSHRPLRAPCGVRSEFHGASQERGRRRDPPASLCAPRRALQVGGHVLVGTRGGAGTVPGPPVGVVVAVGGIGERSVHAVAVLGRCRPVGGRSDEWMRELDAPADREQSGVYRRVDRGHVDLECLGRRVEENRITEWLGGRREHQELRVGWESAEPAPEAVLDRVGGRVTSRQGESAGEL